MTKKHAMTIIRFYIVENLEEPTTRRRMDLLESRVYQRETLRLLAKKIMASDEDPYIVACKYLDKLNKWCATAGEEKLPMFDNGEAIVEDIVKLLEDTMGYDYGYI